MASRASPCDFIGDLKFDFKEVPTWRGDSGEETTAMLSDIVTYYEKYENLPPPAKHFCKTSFAKLMTMKFVLDVNIGESVGTQTADGTRTVLDAYIEKQRPPSNLGSGPGVNNDHVVTINVFETLNKCYDMRDEMEWTGKVTVQQICDMHRVLMKGLRDDAGEIRKTCVFTTWKNEDYFYPEFYVAEQLLYACVDHHSTHMTEYGALAKNAPKVESFRYLFKCAARLLFDFVDAHPFGDGNGRMCRLLANYVLSLITPFPVALYGSGEGRSGREDYVNAIVECRDNRDRGPGTLAAMLIEGTLRGWKSLFCILERHNLTSKMVGPVVVHKGDTVEDRNKKITRALKRFNIESSSLIFECIVRAIDEEHDVTESDAVRKKVPLSDDIILHLHIYA